MQYNKVKNLAIHGEIIAVLVSLTAVKSYMILFKYERFREFVVRMLEDKRYHGWLVLGGYVVLFFATWLAVLVLGVTEEPFS